MCVCVCVYESTILKWILNTWDLKIDWIRLVQYRVQQREFINTAMKLSYLQNMERNPGYLTVSWVFKDYFALQS
jgi:hypothetical protein